MDQTCSAGSRVCLGSPLFLPVESLQPPGKISQHVFGMCLFSNHEPVVLNQAVPDLLNSVLTNKIQQLETTPPLFKKRFVISREQKGMCVVPSSLSPCSVWVAALFLEKKGSLGELLGHFHERTTGLREQQLRPSPQSPSTHNSFERYAKLAGQLTDSLPRPASLQVGFYIYVKQK